MTCALGSGTGFLDAEGSYTLRGVQKRGGHGFDEMEIEMGDYSIVCMRGLSARSRALAHLRASENLLATLSSSCPPSPPLLLLFLFFFFSFSFSPRTFHGAARRG